MSKSRLRSLTLSCVFLGALGERKPPVGHFDEERFMCRSLGCLRQSNALSGVVAQLIEAGQVLFHFYSVLLWLCPNLEFENGGPRVVRSGILCRPSISATPAAARARSGCGMLSHPHATLFGVLLCLPTAPKLPLRGNGDFGTSAFFGQPLGQAAACPYLMKW